MLSTEGNDPVLRVGFGAARRKGLPVSMLVERDIYRFAEVELLGRHLAADISAIN